VKCLAWRLILAYLDWCRKVYTITNLRSRAISSITKRVAKIRLSNRDPSAVLKYKPRRATELSHRGDTIMASAGEMDKHDVADNSVRDRASVVAVRFPIQC